MSRATERAASATTGWKTATRAQRSTRPVTHEDLYDLVGELVDTIATLTDLAGVLAGQAGDYQRTTRGQLYDDSRSDRRASHEVDPTVRLRTAVRELTAVRGTLIEAGQHANDAWSTLSHIGVDLAQRGDRLRGGR